jgi:hypothetical protein
MRASNDGPTRSAPSTHFPKPEEACAGDMAKKTKKGKKEKHTKQMVIRTHLMRGL